MDNLNKKIEAILFSIGDKINIEEISKLTKEKDLEVIKKCLRELRNKYKEIDSPMTLEEEGNFWKMNVRDEHLSTVRKVVKKLELPKTLLETLAVVAWKAPVMQSRVIAVRTNKAYDHLEELEKSGFIIRKKYGRTKLINLTQKFYEYFEINKKGGLGRIFKRVTKRAKDKYGDEFDQKTYESEEEPQIEILQDNQTGEKVDGLEIYEEKAELEVIDDEVNDNEASDKQAPKMEIIDEEELKKKEEDSNEEIKPEMENKDKELTETQVNEEKKPDKE